MTNEIKIYDLCDDIIRDIYSFGYPNHRKYMKDICRMIESNHTSIHKHLHDSWYRNNTAIPITEFINAEFTQTEIVVMFQYYKKCKCCTRHSYYKPNIKSQHFNPKPAYNPHYNTHNITCYCPCRNMSRHLYLAYFN